MNDINNDSSIDLEAKLDTKLAKKIANAKNRRDKRNGDIYKRFLKRVQHPEPHKKLEPLKRELILVAIYISMGLARKIYFFTIYSTGLTGV